MTKFILVRHGESMANAERAFAGEYDVELSPLGEKQAEKTAEYIAKNCKIDKIYASDLKRAYNTAKASADLLGLEITPDKRLREISAGKWEGVRFSDIEKRYPEDYKTWRNDIGHAACTGGESVKELGKRVTAVLAEIAAANEGRTVLVATHATVIRTLECLWRGLPLSEMKDIPWVSNASVTTVEYAPGKIEFLSVGEDAHLKSLKTALPANV